MANYSEVEKKWQKAWEDAKVYEPEPNGRDGYMVHNAFPYVNAPLHIGHFRAYGTADTYARYMRLKGFNVLYPFGFHATGTPVMAFARRIAAKEKELMDELEQIYHIPHEEVVKMSDPAYIAEYMIKRQEAILRRSGLGVDWRRRFITTEPLYSKMVEWQFDNLKKKGYLIQGSHPVSWCPLENHAVGEDDTKGGAHPEIEEIVAVKFKDTASDIFFLCATYRPETVYGVTNIFVKQDAKYSIVSIKGSKYYMSKEAADILRYQLSIMIIGEISATDLLTKKAINPVTKEEIPILPGFFVKLDVGTGLVMSVPSHAPFDYAALERLKTGGYPVPKMEYKRIIEIEKAGSVGIGRSLEGKVVEVKNPDIPALAYLQLLNADANSDIGLLENATKVVYREEARWGKMLVGKYAGQKETVARDGLKKDLSGSGDALLIYEIVNDDPVFCRDGTKIVVNVVTDQWFINYGDKGWKDAVKKKFPSIRVFPSRYAPIYADAINWIDLRAAERAQGLGTKFPLNPKHIIESLSDSTIYMTFYTFDYVLRAADVKPEQLKPSFFDYVLAGSGDMRNVAQETGIDEITIKKCRELFEYWYKRTSSHTANEHVYNHLTMFLYNHIACLPDEYFPKQVAINGMLLYEGEKMSKSLGNIIPLEDGIAKYGADALKAICVTGSELDSVSDFTPSAAIGIMQKNEYLLGMIDTLNTMNGIELEHIDYWLYSKLNTKIKNATRFMDNVEFRGAFTEAYYNSIAELKRYADFGGHNQMVIREFLEAIAVMCAPIMPHFSEELWHGLGNNTFVVQARWPEANENMINTDVEYIANVIDSTMGDITHTSALTSKIDANRGKSIKEVRIIIADDWKTIAYNDLVDKKEMGAVMKNEQLGSVDKEKLSKFLSQFMPKLKTLQKMPEVQGNELYVSFIGSSDFLKKKFNAQVIIEKESESRSNRAARALPDKPSIDIVWG